VDVDRFLVVIADDFGIGSETSRGILELAERGVVTGTVLLVNSPYAVCDLETWRRSGQGLEVGWHPCLTLDRPVLSPDRVPSLVRSDGTFWPLGGFLRRLLLRQIERTQMEAELHAQYRRFIELIGTPPSVVNGHHHIQVFSPVSTILDELLARQSVPPYVRRVREPWGLLMSIPGARLKRTVLSFCGSRAARDQERLGFAENDWLAGITDPPFVEDPEFFSRWLRRVPGHVIELTCHPGHLDTTLIGRDCTLHDGMLQRRAREYVLLNDPAFLEACRRAGFALVSPRELSRHLRGTAHAA
jgi:chitin disaccharide deacetylase